MIYNIDSYGTQLYNRFIKTLKDKDIKYNEFVQFKTYKWYLETEEDPFILDYEEAGKLDLRLLVSRVKTVTKQQEYEYRRPPNQIVAKSNLDLCYNDAYNYYIKRNKNNPEKYFYFFHLDSREAAQEMSKQIGRIYFLGTYKNRNLKIFLTDNQHLPNIIKSYNDILAGGNNLLETEVQLNYDIFLNKERLQKYAESLYLEDGVLIPPKNPTPFLRLG